MNFEQIDESIDRIVAIVAKVPEKFQERTFESLLTTALAEARCSSSAENTVEEKSDTSGRNRSRSETNANSDGPVKARGRYKQFLTDKGINEAEVRKIVELEGNEVIFYRSPDAAVLTAAQIKWALLLALASGLESGNLTVSSDAVRKKVQDERIYDAPNFAKTFKGHKAYFVGTMGKGDPARRLSSDGEDALAALIKTMGA